MRKLSHFCETQLNRDILSGGRLHFSTLTPNSVAKFSTYGHIMLSFGLDLSSHTLVLKAGINRVHLPSKLDSAM